MPQENLSDRIREALRPRGSRILPLSDLTTKVLGAHAPDAERDKLRDVVSDLERKGELVRVRGEKLSLIEHTDLRAGTFGIRGESRAVLLSGEPGVPDLPIPPGKSATALDGDFVLVRLEKEKATRNRRGGLFPPRAGGPRVQDLVRRRETLCRKANPGP